MLAKLQLCHKLADKTTEGLPWRQVINIYTEMKFCLACLQQMHTCHSLTCSKGQCLLLPILPPLLPWIIRMKAGLHETNSQPLRRQSSQAPNCQRKDKASTEGVPSIRLIYTSELPSTGACHDWKHICAKCLLKPHKSLWPGINKLFQLQKFPYTQDVQEIFDENQLTYRSKITSVV